MEETFPLPMYVCPDCFADENLRRVVEGDAVATRCDFCGTRSRTLIGAPLTRVAEYIDEYLRIKYCDPANSLPYDSGEGGYQGIVWTTQELLEEVGLELPRDDEGHLLVALAREIDGLPDAPQAWAERDPWGLPEQEQLRISWESFARFVMHHRRFFFRQNDLPRDGHEDPDRLGPDELLRRIAQRAVDVGLIERLSAGTRIYRARYQERGEVYDTAMTLGPPPPESATQNRTSPAGIPMFHGAEDPETAVEEIHLKPGDYAVGEFVVTREAWILDLHDVPGVPSYFSEIYGWQREALIFLHGFAAEVSQPIARDGKEHVTYVPTQVMTEYFKTHVTYEGSKLAGLSFTSSRTRRRNYTLFLTQEEMVPVADGPGTEPLLRLEGVTVLHR